MKKTILISVTVLACCMLHTTCCFPQGAAINTTNATAESSAMLDVASSTTGFLLPRMSNAERNAIVAPAQSLIIFNTTTTCFEYYYSGVWYSMSCTCSVPFSTTANDASNITSTSFTANWNPSGGAATYYLDVATVSSFTGFVGIYNNLNVGGVTSWNVTGLTGSATYYYRVRSNNSCGTSSNSNTITVSTPFACGSVLTDSRDSKTYNTVLIGSQCWLAQELNYGNYVDIHSGAQGNGEKYCQNLSGNNDPTCPLGGLYEWANLMCGSGSCNGTGASQVRCTMPVQGLCPDGWHIPSHYEWVRLERDVGGSDSAVYLYDLTSTGWFGNIGEGSMLKENGTTHWTSPNNCNPSGTCNTIAFTALPGGNSGSGLFVSAGIIGYWWSSTENNSTNAWNRDLLYSYSTAGRYADSKSNGYSVRCVKD